MDRPAPFGDTDLGGDSLRSLDCWAAVSENSDFTLANLPYGVASIDGIPQIVTRIGDAVLPLSDVMPGHRHLFERHDLNPLMGSGPATWRDVRRRIVEFLTDRRNERTLTPVDDVRLHLPVAIGDYVDFYSSIHHAISVGRILRPGDEPLSANWRRLPVGYHGRAGSIAVSGTPVIRPSGLVAAGASPGVGLESDGVTVDSMTVERVPSRQLDFELEVGFVVGRGTDPNQPLSPDGAAEHVFGMVLVNDWSARDLQAFEYRPLGPFLAKSFLTTISPWVIPMDALGAHLVAPPEQDPPPDAGLVAARDWGLDLELAVHLNGTRVCRTNLRHLYWTFAQQLSHLTSNGAATRTGDLFASGTASGPTPGEAGSLLELARGGAEPVVLDDGTQRSWLADGDTVTISGWAGGTGGLPRIGFGTATGTVACTPSNRSRSKAPDAGRLAAAAGQVRS